MHRHHRPVDTGVDLPPESHELLGWLWAKERVESVDGRLAVFIDGNEVDRVRSRELGGAVTGDPIGWTVAHLPVPVERIGEVDCRDHDSGFLSGVSHILALGRSSYQSKEPQTSQALICHYPPRHIGHRLTFARVLRYHKEGATRGPEPEMQ